MSAPKAGKETVIEEHRDGRPHFTIDEGGTLRHYGDGTPGEGEVIRPAFAGVVRVALAPASMAPRSAGPAKVSSDEFRTGWDAIDWSRKAGDKPS